MNIRSFQMGFTLIELMIVVAVIGILAAIAIPQYQIYAGKAQLAEAIAIVDGRRVSIAERIQNGFALASIDGDTNGIPPDISSGAGRYADSVVVAAGVITVTMKDSGVSPCISAATLTLSPNIPASDFAPISWNCTTTAICKPISCN